MEQAADGNGGSANRLRGAPIDFEQAAMGFGESSTDFEESPIGFGKTPIDFEEARIGYEEAPISLRAARKSLPASGSHLPTVRKSVLEQVPGECSATRLYWDDKSQRPKRGAAPNKRKPGTLRRFVDVIQQLELTYDLYSMDGREILTLLPDEFTPWRKPAEEVST